MQLVEIRDILNAKMLNAADGKDIEIQYGGAADLMSDILAFVSHDDTVILSGLTNEQVVRTAEMVDVPAIVFVRGKVPPDNVISLAVEKGIALLCTRDTMYVACGKLYKAGLDGFVIDSQDRG